MQLVRGLHNRALLNTPAVATIGSFDAIHIGHQALLARLCAVAKQDNCASTVILFEPQPREFFQPDHAPARVLRLRDKISILRTLGVDQVWCLRFNHALAALSAEEFVQIVLVDVLQTKHLIIGDDFRFGAGRKGDKALLQTIGQASGFTVADSPTCELQGRRVSSTWVREAIAAGDFALVNTLINRPYQLSGKVQHGDARGRLFGFPTLNIRLEHPMALSGVYVVKVDGLVKSHFGVANVGVRPTVDGLRRLLEIHVFDFNQTVYGRKIQVTFLKQLRSEQKFADIGALTQQIQRDVAAAREYLTL